MLLYLLYLILSGKTRIVIENAYGEERVVNVLSTGDCFGEIALIENVPRTARAAAATDLCVLSLTKDCFYELIGKSILTGAEFNRLADRRMNEMSKNPAAVDV